MNADDNDIAYLGHRDIWGGTKPFGLSRADRNQHLLILGKTGSGKTTMIRNLLLHDIAAGEGLCVIDPHGDLSVDLLDHIPPSRSRDVIYFNAADGEYPIGFNLFRGHDPERAPLIASSIVGAMKSIWRDSWGPRLEYFLYAAVAALAECENTSLLGVHRMFADERYRSWVVGQVSDPVVRTFWLEFENYDRRFLTEALAPIENKVGRLLMSPIIRNSLGQISRAIDPRAIMDRHQVLIANLAKGIVGDDAAHLLGSMLLSQFEQAALSQADTAAGARPRFSLVVDEFQNFLTDSFISMLSENRKYGLSVTLATQFLANIAEDVRDAVLGNVGSIISFRVGATDAQVLEREFGGSYPAGQFTDLPNFHVLAKLAAGGEYRQPFHGTTLPPHGKFYGHSDQIIRSSRERYATPRHIVDAKIRRWLDSGKAVD
jgi:energy-coupling factor transporter ATP-binding protein EcfA2